MDSIFIVFGILLGFALMVLPLLVLLHELGHAVPALLFTKADVSIYLGSYGDSANTWQVQIGLLKIYIKRSLFWTKGLCTHTNGGLSKTKQCLIILGGVLISLLIAVLGFYAALSIDLHGSVKLFMFLLVLFSVVSIVTNLVPSQRSGLPNDGMLLRLLLTDGKLNASFSPALKELIAQSRLVAFDLGYDYVSTIHLLLADCDMPYPYSLANLFFSTPEERNAFYEGFRVGPAVVVAGSLHLTVAFEQALKIASQTQHYGFRRELYPCHLLVAACQVVDSEFDQVTPDISTLLPQLLAYYRTFDELLAD